MFRVCSEYAQSMFRVFSGYVQSMFRGSSQYVQSRLRVGSEHVQSMFRLVVKVGCQHCVPVFGIFFQSPWSCSESGVKCFWVGFCFIRQLTRTLLYPSLCWYDANDEYREQRIYTDHLNGQMPTFWLSGQHFQFSDGHLCGDIKIVLQIENGDFTALQYTVSLENVLDISIEPYKT